MLFIQMRRSVRGRTAKRMALAFLVILFSPVAWCQQQNISDLEATEAFVSGAQDAQGHAGNISGKVVDQSGAEIVGAVVKFRR